MPTQTTGPDVAAAMPDLRDGVGRRTVVAALTAAATFGGRTLAVILTGIGYDGLLGTRDVVAAGGHAIAQDQATSVVWGMPGSVAEAGLADLVLPLDRIGPEITARSRGRVPATAGRA